MSNKERKKKSINNFFLFFLTGFWGILFSKLLKKLTGKEVKDLVNS